MAEQDILVGGKETLVEGRSIVEGSVVADDELEEY